MAKTAKSDTAEMRYLLEDLSEDERTRIEEAFFAHDSKFEAVELAEDELVDAYVRKELSPEELRRFKAKVLKSPRLLERVNFATALAEKVDSFPAQQAEAPVKGAPARAAETTPRWWKAFFAQRPAYGMAMAACVLLILVAGALLISGWLRLRSESERLANERASLQRQKEELDKQSAAQRAKTEELNAQLDRDQGGQSQQPNDDLKGAQKRGEPGQRSFLGSMVTLSLTSGTSRSPGKGNELTLAPGDSIVKLDLALENIDYKSYSAKIENAEGKVIVHHRGLKAHNGPSGKVLTIKIPVKLLPPDDYIVTVSPSGTSDTVADYSFRVLKRQ